MLMRPINPLSTQNFRGGYAFILPLKDPVTVEQFSQWFFIWTSGDDTLRRRVAVDGLEQVLGYGAA